MYMWSEKVTNSSTSTYLSTQCLITKESLRYHHLKGSIYYPDCNNWTHRCQSRPTCQIKYIITYIWQVNHSAHTYLFSYHQYPLPLLYSIIYRHKPTKKKFSNGWIKARPLFYKKLLYVKLRSTISNCFEKRGGIHLHEWLA